MYVYMLRKNLLLNIAKILNIFAFVFSLFVLMGALTYDWSRMPYTDTSLITLGGSLFSVCVFMLLTFTFIFSFYVLRRLSKENEALKSASEEIESSEFP